MTKKNSLKKLLLLIKCSVLIVIISCSDDVITNKEPPVIFDTVETYSWITDTISHYYLTNFDVVDSENIFFTSISAPSIFKYDGQSYNPIDLQDPIFRGNEVKAWDKNNIFVGGGHTGGIWLPAVMKILRDGIVYNYEVPDDSTVNIGSILLVDRDKAWLGCNENNIVYFFDNGNFIKHKVGVGEINNFFRKDSNGNLYLFSSKFIGNLPPFEIIFYMRKLVGNEFILVTVDSTFSSSGKHPDIQTCSNGDIVFSGKNNLYNVKNDNFEIIYSETIINFGSAIGGLSKDNLLIERDHRDEFPTRSSYIWNGNKLKVEKYLRFNYYSNVNKIFFFGRKAYVLTSSPFVGINFIKGTKK